MAQADVLILKNGDRLTGEVLNETDGVLKFNTSYAGILSIQWNEVSEVRTDKSMVLLLEEGEVLTGLVVKNNGDTLQLENEDNRAVRELTKRSVKEINPESWRLGKGYKFSGMINISMKYDRGNNDNDVIDLDGNLEFRRLYDRVRFYGEYDVNRTKGITTKLKWLVAGAYDYFPTSDWSYVFDAPDWFIGLGLNLKKDEFAELNLRTRFGPHIGYQFYESKPLNLLVQGGFEAVKEEFTGGEDNQYWANTWRLVFDRYLYKEKVQFYFISDGFYGFASPDKTILENWTGFRFPLKIGFVASIEAETDYDSQPAENVEKLSTSYRFKLGYKF
ncbi:MAG: DUF481 domain-containing protein [Gammaproteobacteria bacterium]|nr:MAG: DUF481 domain-containing protein [Gammaproteobacteria bacterium]